MRKLIIASPLLLVILLAASFILLLSGLWIWSLTLIISAILINRCTQVFSFHPLRKQADRYDFRVLTMNANRAHKISVNKGTADELIDFIVKQDADIVLLQEYNAELYPLVQERLKMVYPFGSDEAHSRFKSVFSRFPIESCEQLVVEASNPRYKLLQSKYYCKKTVGGTEILPISKLKVRINGKLIQIFNCHLMSNNYSVVVRNLRKKNKALIRGVVSIWKRIDFGSKVRKLQTEIICDHFEQEMPTLVCGDFNDVNGSSALSVFRNRRFVDSWWKNGLGFGFTFHGMGLRLRLDHILYDPQKFKLVNISVPYSDVSDHNPIICSFVIGKNSVE